MYNYNILYFLKLRINLNEKIKTDMLLIFCISCSFLDCLDSITIRIEKETINMMKITTADSK